ncbi:MAG TPA: response regulator [Rhodobacteraceae bacterium]|nr:response regulator [Paracoccaceae bacterium]
MTKTEPQMNEPDPADPEQIENILLSHDIRSALSQIVHAGHALEDAGLSDTHSVFLRQISSAALYINDLLEVVTAQPDAVPVSELEPLLTQLETLWAPETAKKGLAFSVVRKGSLPGSLRLPKIDFLRILNNILSNALKFSSQGALTLRIARVNNGALLLEVVDDGPGFSKDAQQKLFSLRGRPENADKEGSGLGLYIARALVKKAGGEIKAENRPSGGARVSVIFPEDLLIGVEKPVAKPKTGLPDLSHLNILLAEDNPTNQLVATHMLKKMGATVEAADDGVEAMSAFDSGDYNLGLIDIEMPRKSGLEVMREMRARTDEKAKTTLLALTAYVLPEHRESIMASGADGIIAKPLTDIAAFGNAILIVTGTPEVESNAAPVAPNQDADIQMDVYNGLKDIIGDDSMLELLGKVHSDLTDVRAGVQAGVANKDTGPIRANTHILISVAGAFGAVNLQHLAEALNATAKTDDWARITPDAARCEQGITDVLCFVSAELGGAIA